MNFSERKQTHAVRVGDLTIGAGQPIVVQSMTMTDARDIEATVREVRALEEAGCELVRVTVPDEISAAAITDIRRQVQVPFVADIHYSWRAALASIEAGADKVRINPGNIGSQKKVERIVRAAKERGTALRIGVNSGSLERDLLERFGSPTAEALAESALRHSDFVLAQGYDQFVVSIKSTDVRAAIQSNEIFSSRSDQPLHLGITEAGTPPYGTIKSAVGLGALLLQGIGDTIRVSLTADSTKEIPVAFDILKATGARVTEPELIACPTCGRIDIDLEGIVAEVQDRLREQGVKSAIKISILGCVVNGPGEAREADIGIAGGKGQGILFRHGELIRRVPEADMVDALMEEILKMEAEPSSLPRAPAAPENATSAAGTQPLPVVKS
jgi:(E)-4-hydroxy-3-methylbut-2-enyl-diphosphate synthase